MKKCIQYMVMLLFVVTLAACSSGSEGGPDYDSPDYGKLVITHTNKDFSAIPTFTGSEITGTITWSDGQSEEYKKATVHIYEGAAPYVVTYDLWKAEKVTIPGLGGLREVDFSQF